MSNNDDIFNMRMDFESATVQNLLRPYKNDPLFMEWFKVGISPKWEITGMWSQPNHIQVKELKKVYEEFDRDRELAVPTPVSQEELTPDYQKLLLWYYLPPRSEFLRLFPELEYPQPNEWSPTPVYILPDGKSNKEIQIPNNVARQGIPAIERYLKKRQEYAEKHTKTFWHRFCSSFGWWEILTEEMVKSLAVYLFDRAKVYYDELKVPIKIAEVGAGDGRLFMFLKVIKDAYVKENGEFPIEMYANDSGSWGFRPIEGSGVELCDYKEFLNRIQPQIIFVSWMPQGNDWSQTFRDTNSCMEYVCIGDIDTGITGHVWLTWGNSHLPEDQRPKAPYAKDGWTRHDVPDVSRYQISRLDKYGCWFNSTTVAFRRPQSLEVINIPLSHLTSLPKLEFKLNFPKN